MITRNILPFFVGITAQDLFQVWSGRLDYAWWECIASSVVACGIALLVLRYTCLPKPPEASP